MSRKQAKLRRQAGDVIRALVAEVRAHADDYHHKTSQETLKRAAEFLCRLEGRRPPKASDSGTPANGPGR